MIQPQKIKESNNSSYIKLSLMNYFKFQRQFLCASEVPLYYGIEDVVAMSKDKKVSYTIEVKCSFSDYKADFKNKASKHMLYKKGRGVTNYFYFACLKPLADRIKPLLPKQYGLILVENNLHCKIIKRATKFDKTVQGVDSVMSTLVNRMNNELITVLEKDYLRRII